MYPGGYAGETDRFTTVSAKTKILQKEKEDKLKEYFHQIITAMDPKTRDIEELRTTETPSGIWSRFTRPEGYREEVGDEFTSGHLTGPQSWRFNPGDTGAYAQGGRIGAQEGGGDIDAGAEVMENVMNNLEQGGQISEESQGLEGARDMFATSQRLEGVL